MKQNIKQIGLACLTALVGVASFATITFADANTTDNTDLPSTLETVVETPIVVNNITTEETRRRKTFLTGSGSETLTDTSSITELEISFKQGSVNVRRTTEKEISLDWNLNPQFSLEKKWKNGKLELELDDVANTLKTTNAGDLIIYIPESMTFRSVKFETGLGTSVIEHISAYEADFEAKSGDLTIHSFQVDSVSLETKYGKINASGVANRVETDADYGTINLNLAGNAEEYKREFKADSGTLIVDSQTYSNLRKKIKLAGSSAKKLTAEVETGSINIQFSGTN
ncbi:hypothetical protein FACS189418_6510 [Clostridia bacterium]|nr:hypothetical protein FACS189418_6510 [Clostridia bacterium]